MEDGDKFAGIMYNHHKRNMRVFNLDITSMYPSVIMSLNISTETKIGKLSGWDAKEFMRGDKKTYTLKSGDKEMGKLTETE